MQGMPHACFKPVSLLFISIISNAAVHIGILILLYGHYIISKIILSMPPSDLSIYALKIDASALYATITSHNVTARDETGRQPFVIRHVRLVACPTPEAGCAC